MSSYSVSGSVIHHVKEEEVEEEVEEEESEIFDVVCECMDDEELEELAQEFKAAKTRLEFDVRIALV